MDVAVLRDRIQATLDPNAAIRQQAELDLKHVRALLSIVYARDICIDGILGRRATGLHRWPAEHSGGRAGPCHTAVE